MKQFLRMLAATLVLCASGASQAQQSIDPKTFSAIEQAQRAQQAGRQSEALATLQAARDTARRGSLEAALLDQRLAYLALERDRTAEAIVLLRQALDSGALSDEAATQDRRNLAQLLMSQGQHAEAIALLESEQQRGELTLPLKRLLVQAYSEAQQYSQAIAMAEQVVRAEPGVDDVWYRLLVGMNHRLERYAQAERWLKVLLTRGPGNAENWRQLAGVQSLDNRQVEAAATLRLAFEAGIRLSEQDLQNLVALQVQAGAPWQAARLLRALIDQRLLPATAQRQRLLAQLWQQARDHERAEAAWRELAMQSGEADDWLRVASIQLDNQDWEALLATLKRAQSGASADQLRLIEQWRAYARSMQAQPA